MNKNLLLAFGLLTLVGCNRGVIIPNGHGDTDDMSYLSFESAEILRQEIVGGAHGVETKSQGGGNYVTLFSSVKDIDIQNDPILSYEYTIYGNKSLDEKASLYYRLGYDELVPNKGFAQLINARGEFAVGDTMYKISPRGTYHFPVSLREEFEKNYAGYETQNGVLVSDKTYELAPSIFRYDTFGDSEEVTEGDYVLCDIGHGITKSDPIPAPLWSEYPVYRTSADKCFNNQVFTYSLPGNRRVRTKVYHHDYVVYDERGSTLKCQKSGFLGWSAVTSEALMITWKNIILQGGHSPGELAPPSNTIPTIVMTTTSYMGYNEPLAEIRGYVLPENLYNGVVIGGNPTLRSIIQNATGFDIGNTRLLRLVGHDFVQIIHVGTWSVSGVNTNEIAMALSEMVMGRTFVPVGGQFCYQALDDNGNVGALRVGTAF